MHNSAAKKAGRQTKTSIEAGYAPVASAQSTDDSAKKIVRHISSDPSLGNHEEISASPPPPRSTSAITFCWMLSIASPVQKTRCRGGQIASGYCRTFGSSPQLFKRHGRFCWIASSSQTFEGYIPAKRAIHQSCHPCPSRVGSTRSPASFGRPTARWRFTSRSHSPVYRIIPSHRTEQTRNASI